MKALTVQQPWATAIVEWGKSPENRTRNLAGSYRGPIAIHAGKTVDVDAHDDPLIRAHSQDGSYFVEDGRDPFPLRAIIGVANLWAVHHAAPGCCPNRGAPPFGSPWAQPDQWHLCLAGARRLAEPVPCRGALGLWTVPSDVVEPVALQLERLVPEVPC